MTRALRRWLPQLPELNPTPTPSPAPLERVWLASPARRQLSPALYAPGQWCGGALFGQPNEGELQVLLATPARQPTVRPDPGGSPLDLDPGYLLGASDALARLNLGLDWVGHWLMAPDRRLPPLRRDLRWVAQAGRQGLVDEQHPLLSVGWFEGSFEARAYLLDGDTPKVIEVRFWEHAER